jgi:hypothetical protein
VAVPDLSPFVFGESVGTTLGWTAENIELAEEGGCPLLVGRTGFERTSAGESD